MKSRENGKALIEALTQSDLYQDFLDSFSDLTGLALALRPVESWKLPYHGRRRENAYCRLVACRSKTCAWCLQTIQRVSQCALREPASVTCPSGLTETAVPIRLGDRTIGFLQTGQLFRRKPSDGQFERVARQLEQAGVDLDFQELRRAYYRTPVIPPRQHEAIVRMLRVFSVQMSSMSNQLLLCRSHPEPPLIQKAKQYIQEHQTEDLSLGQVAKAVNTSTFYFCKIFKKHTGLNFTEYVSRVRVERAKNLALNPHLRISDIAYEVGFQSLTHFNRVFKKITGMSPTQYRAKLPKP